MADTIAALATGGGLSAIGIIRLSGERAVEIADEVFKPQGSADMLHAENRRLYYGALKNTKGETIDFGLCTEMCIRDSVKIDDLRDYIEKRLEF